jgi:hypothetical protein
VLLKDPSIPFSQEPTAGNKRLLVLVARLRVAARQALEEYGNSVFVCLD